MIKKRYLFLTFLFFSSLNVSAMEDEKIKINGERKPLLAHIVLAMTYEPDHLKNIDFIRYEEDKYIMLAKGKPDLSEEDIQQVNKNNFVYLPFYTMEKRGGSTYENIGAVVIGTKDEETANNVHFIALDSFNEPAADPRPGPTGIAFRRAH